MPSFQWSSYRSPLELVNSLAGVKIAHAPYKGAGQALIDLMAGQVQVFFSNILSSLQYVRMGKICALAVTSGKRSSAMPELPTVMESDVPGYETTTWHGWLAPRGSAAGAGRETQHRTRARGAFARCDGQTGEDGEAVAGTPDQFRNHLTVEIARWRKVVRDAGIRADNAPKNAE